MELIVIDSMPCVFQYAGDDDIYDEDEVRNLLLSGSEEDTEIITEIGYDADSEETHMDEGEKGNYTQ